MKNPVPDVISDELFGQLTELGLINHKGIRDYQIRKKFRDMRSEMPASHAIEHLRNDYPYLQYDTIRKIVYQSKPKESNF